MVDEFHKFDAEKEIHSYEKFLVSERKSQHTVKQYKSMLKCFIQYANKDLKNISNTDIENFKSYLVVDKKYSKASQYLSMKVLKSYYLFRNTPVPVNLAPPRRSQKMPVYLNDHDAHRLLEFSNDIRLHAIISTFLYTGIRVSELTNILINDIDLQENIIYVHSGKGDKDRIVIIPDSCKKDLSEYLKIRLNIKTPSKNFFVSNKKTKFDTSTIERVIKKTAEKAGLQRKVTPHVLRHTFASSVLRNGGDIRFIQQILGHSSVATTQIYTHIDDNVLKEMYNMHKPKY